ncbi:sialic acid-binding Ig-like lectin 10 [Mauremys reevesii]|uniref:sialic acid-binding Ig-like lectin 10 n=1 Tax=Mauremys reevesii TaxID=260615 RepID=UPI00193FBB61|nr:sialic acid-binding Ig-like lectin 10 [Mauremys reevesii]
MGRAPMPQHDAGKRELPPQGPPWRAGGPATLRVLILALLWRGSLAQQAGFTLTVPQSVSVQEGLCVLIPCTFTYPASYDTKNSSARLYRYWYKDQAQMSRNPPVASSDPSRGVSQETQGRFQLAENPARGDCSLQINDARRTDAGRYVLRVEGVFSYNYLSTTDGTDLTLTISVPRLTEEPEIQISLGRGLPGTLLAGEPVTVTCTAPGRCSGSPPRVTWTGPFSDTAQNVSAQLANGTWAHSSTLSFTPGPGDHGKELVCNVTYRPPQGPSTHRTVRLHVGLTPPVLSSPPDLPCLVCVTDPPRPPNITGTLTRNGRPVPDVWGAEGDVMSLKTQEGDSLSLSCEAGSRPKATLSWAKGNESLSPGQRGAGLLELPNLSRGDAGEYRCWAKNSYGSASRALRVHMQRKALGGAGAGSGARGLSPLGCTGPDLAPGRDWLAQGASGSVLFLFSDPSTLVANWSQLSAREGDSLRFLCSIASSPPAALGWVRGGRAIEGSRPTGENQLQLELPSVTAEDGGLYGCWAQNKESSAQGTFQLLIEYSPRPGTGLNSSCQRQGPSVSCSCSLRSQPPPQLQWQVDGEPLAGNSSRGALQVSSWAQGDEAVSTLSWTGSGDRGPQIFCLGSNPHGSYAALHFDFSPLQRGAEEPVKLLGIGAACGLGVAVGFFLLGLCVIKLRGRKPAPPSAEPVEMANGSQAEHTADDASLIYSNIPTLPMDHKTPAARRTKGIQDGAAAAQAPLGPGELDELHYASIDFSKLQPKRGEPAEAPATEYSEVRLK